MATKIEWCNIPGHIPETWNFIGGCAPVSPGCENCWAARMAATRLKTHQQYKGLTEIVDGTPRWTGKLRFHDEELIRKPLHWMKPRAIFVSSMSDLFHKDVETTLIYDAFRTMEICRKHTFFLLTKRPKRMRSLMNGVVTARAVEHRKHIWPGVTVESSDYLGRIEELLEIPAAVRWVSIEPLLSEIDMGPWLSGWSGQKSGLPEPLSGALEALADIPALDWVVVGCESGPNRRPCKLEWVESIVEQCKAAGVPVFVKQLDINGRVEKDIERFPKHLQVREWPK